MTDSATSSALIFPDSHVLLESLRQCQAKHGESTSLEKLHKLMKKQHPNWNFSLTRLRKIRKDAGLAPSPYPDLSHVAGDSDSFVIDNAVACRRGIKSELIQSEAQLKQLGRPISTKIRHTATLRHIANRGFKKMGDLSPLTPAPRSLVKDLPADKLIPIKIKYAINKNCFTETPVILDFTYKIPKRFCWARNVKQMEANFAASAPYIDDIIEDIRRNLVAEGVWICSGEECKELATIFFCLPNVDVQSYPVPTLDAMAMPACDECSDAVFEWVNGIYANEKRHKNCIL